jgi:hypothetical protein
METGTWQAMGNLLFNKYYICIVNRKRSLFRYSAASYGIIAVLILAGCAKVETTTTTTTSDTTTQTTIAGDEVTVNNEFDNAVDDAVTVLSNPNAVITHADIGNVATNVYEIVYTGTESDTTKSRMGADSIHLGAMAWKNATASANIAFGFASGLPEYEVSFLSNNTSLRIVGNATVTNVYGGLLQNLAAEDSMVVHIRATITFTYNDQTSPPPPSFTWNINQIRTYTLVGGNIMATTRGDTTYSNVPNVGTWGATRVGGNFYTATVTAVVQNISTANLSYNPMSGVKNIEGISQPILCTYGVNSQGNVISTGTPYGFYISWNNNGVQTAATLAYYY